MNTKIRIEFAKNKVKINICQKIKKVGSKKLGVKFDKKKNRKLKVKSVIMLEIK